LLTCGCKRASIAWRITKNLLTLGPCVGGHARITFGNACSSIGGGHAAIASDEF